MLIAYTDLLAMKCMAILTYSEDNMGKTESIGGEP